jgi:hypothetical protein
LLLRGAERNLLERAIRQHVAALIGLREAAAEREAERERGRDGKRTEGQASGHAAGSPDTGILAPLRHPGG